MVAGMDQDRPAVLVTGGAKRIGGSISRAFAKAGWHVVIHYNSSADSAEDLAAELAMILFPGDLVDNGWIYTE